MAFSLKTLACASMMTTRPPFFSSLLVQMSHKQKRVLKSCHEETYIQMSTSPEEMTLGHGLRGGSGLGVTVMRSQLMHSDCGSFPGFLVYSEQAGVEQDFLARLVPSPDEG